MGSRAHTPETRPLHVYRLVYGPDWVIAHDEDDAWAVWCASNGEKREDYEPYDTWRRLDDDETIMVVTEPCRAGVTMTAREWADSNGRGFLCSTEY